MKQESTVEAKVSYWQEMVAIQEASGLSARQFCERQGLVLSQFYYWRRRLRADSFSSISPSADPVAPFVELGLSKDPGLGSSWEIRLELGSGCVLQIRRG